MSVLPESVHSLHPVTAWQRRRYLLRHWRYAEAQRRLLRDLLGWARPLAQRLRAWQPHQPSPLSPSALLAWLHPGNILLDADGAELFWLERLLAGPARPVVVYRSDIRQTIRFTYHPVETVWLLEQAGYRVQLLTADGPTERQENWYNARPDGAPGPWLLATPSGRAEAVS
jgi:hypothetical protein